MRILLVEDDQITATFIGKALEERGYVVDHVMNGDKGLELARENGSDYSVIILDIMLPVIDGLKICKTIRKEGVSTPILILSGRDEVENKIEGLNAGGDDYMTKPFDVSELIARVKALERRLGTTHTLEISIRNIVLDPSSQEVRVDGKEIELTRLEYRLLYLLMKEKGKLVTRTDIIDKVWDRQGGSMFSNSVSVHIKTLRKKLEEDPKNPLIHTIRGSGYKFADK